VRHDILGLESEVLQESLHLSLRLSEIYERVEFSFPTFAEQPVITIACDLPAMLSSAPLYRKAEIKNQSRSVSPWGEDQAVLLLASL
jgi:hypothetical protein